MIATPILHQGEWLDGKKHGTPCVSLNKNKNTSKTNRVTTLTTASIDLPKKSTPLFQNGIGLNLGIGLKYDFKFGLGIQANPYTSIHSLLSISNENYPERVSEGGIKLGVTYRVK